MAVALWIPTQLQQLDDVPVLGAGQDGFALTYNHGAGAFDATAMGRGGGARLYSAVVDAAGGGDYTTLAAAVSAATAGDAIFVRAGVVPGGVTIDKALTIVGEGTGAVLQSPLSSTPCLTITAADVVLENLTIDGRRADQSGTGDKQNFAGIYNVGGARMVVRNCAIENTLGNGITIESTSGGGPNSLISGCTISNIATNGAAPTLSPVLVGIQVFGSASKQVTITNCYITGWAQAIGLWYGPSQCVVTFNQLVANYGYFTGAVGGTRSAVEDYGADVAGHGYNIFYGNVIDGSTSCCIECAQGVTGSQFIANTLSNYDKFADNTGGPFVIVDGGVGQETSDVTIANNVVFGNAASGRSCLVVGPGHSIIGNKFYGFTSAGISTGIIYPQGSVTTGLRIDNNLFSNCRGAIYLATGMADGASVCGNTIKLPASTTPLISIVAGGKHNISNNDLNAGGVDCPGIYLTSTAGANSRVTGNTMVGFISWCIDIRSGYNLVTGNHCQTTNVFGGIQLYGATAARNNVRWNYVDSNNVSRTIYIDGGAAYNVVQENMLIGAGTMVYDTGSNGNINAPNDRSTNAYRIPITGRSLGAKTIGTSEVTIAHGLLWIAPVEVRIRMTSAGTIWESKAADDTNIYLTADAASRTAEVIVL